MRDTLARVLELQTQWTHENTPPMEERGRLVRREAPQWLRARLGSLQSVFPERAQDLAAEGRDGTGRKTEIPWVRVHSETRSPDARHGWYLVYLFDAPGNAVYLSLNQGTTKFEAKQFEPLPDELLQERVRWARHVVEQRLGHNPDLLNEIDLQPTRSLGRAYEKGNVAAIRYDGSQLPDTEQLEADLNRMANLLAGVYEAELRGQAPGEIPVEIEMAEGAVSEAAGKPPRPHLSGFRPNGPQRRAIEDRAMQVARDHLEARAWRVHDVSATHPYDLHAYRSNEELHVEVKGTASDGAEVLVTRNEVAHAREAHPASALFVVSRINLQGSQAPTAVGGELRTIVPWEPLDEQLVALAYRCRLDPP